MDPMTPKTRSVRTDSLMNSSPIPTVHKTLTLPDLCDDVLLLICNLLKHHHHQQTPWKHLSLTNRRLYHLLTPQLFNTIRITAPLKALDPNTLTPHLHHHVRTLKIDMFGSLWWWCSGAYVSSSDAIDLFTFVRSLLRLERLEVRMMSRSLDIFSTAFTECSSSLSPELFELRGVKTLTVNSSAAFLVTHCPDLETLVLRGKGDGEDCAMEKYTDLESLLETMPPPSLRKDQGSLFKCAEGLRSFDGSASWSLPELTFLTTTFPHLHHLVLRSESYCYRADVASMMRVLGPCLKQLKTLQISKIEYLDMGYRGLWKRAVMECKTEEARRALWEDNEKRRVVAENEVARLAFGSLGALIDLWVGEQRVARRSQQTSKGVRQIWIWDRKADTVGDYAVVGTMWAKYQKEREDVIERSELGM